MAAASRPALRGAGQVRQVSLETWRQSIASKRGPEGYTLRLVLLAIAAIMEREGADEILISYRELIEATSLSRTWLGEQLREACAAGWLHRRQAHELTKAYSAYLYRRAVPADLPPFNRLFHGKRSGDVNRVRR